MHHAGRSRRGGGQPSGQVRRRGWEEAGQTECEVQRAWTSRGLFPRSVFRSGCRRHPDGDCFWSRNPSPVSPSVCCGSSPKKETNVCRASNPTHTPSKSPAQQGFRMAGSLHSTPMPGQTSPSMRSAAVSSTHALVSAVFEIWPRGIRA